MDNIENFFKENIESFNDQEPESGHFERFSDKLEIEQVQHLMVPSRSMFLKIAAVIILFMTVAVFVFDFAANKLKSTIETKSAGTALPTEMEDALHYYDRQTSNRMGEFKILACCGEQKVHLNTLISGELNALDVNAVELKKALDENPGNERIQAALIQNQQMKEKIVNNVITLLKQNRK
jgi:hypothetical protein